MRRLIATLGLALIGLVVLAALRMEPSPLPPQWNVFEPLDVTAPVTPLTRWKLDWAAQDRDMCLDVLAQAASFEIEPDLIASPNCGIAPRVSLSAVGAAQLPRLETNCASALRLTMWARHSVQPAARAQLGASVTQVAHLGSYNCRPIRGSTTRWSTHATADAIDIAGFELSNGQSIRLIRDWQTEGPEAAFLRDIRDGACTWFKTTLGPDFNSLHADHFHLQARGWGTCR